MTSPTDLAMLLDLARQHLREYAAQVDAVRHLQRVRSPFETMESTAARAKAEDALDAQTALLLIPEVPPFVDPLDVLDGPPPADLIIPPVPDLVTDGLTMQGRGFREPYFAVTLGDGRVNVRIDDNFNSISWVELNISEELVFKWHRQLAQHDAEEEAELREQGMADDTPTPVA